MLAAYRATGADPPFGDPRGYHGVGMEGHFWRFTQPRTGAVVVAIVAISRDAQGRPWAMASLAAHPGGAVRSATLADAWAAPRGLALRGGDAVAADERSLHVDLGEDGRLSVAFADPLPWPRRAFGGARAGAGHPWAEPVLAPVAAARAGERERTHRRRHHRPRRRRGLRREELGCGRHAAGVVVGPGARLRPPRVCVAFAGGRAGVGRLRATATALVVAVGDEVRSVVRPLRPLRVAVDERGWRLAGGGIEVEAHADGVAPHRLPVPVPHERRRLDDWAPQHLTGSLRLSVRRGGRTLYEGTSALAGLERGRGHLG